SVRLLVRRASACINRSGSSNFAEPCVSMDNLNSFPHVQRARGRRYGQGKIADGTASAYNEFPMIQANCRARFTATDFDFVVRTLARSQTDCVSLVDLLSDSNTRDEVLDHPRLVDAILSNAGHLRISSQFYF